MQWSDFQNLFYLKNQKETLEIVTLKLREWNPHISEGQPCILLKAVCRSFQSYSFVKRSLQMKTIYSYISYILHFRDNFSSICNKNENLSSKVNSLFLQNTDIVTSLGLDVLPIPQAHTSVGHGPIWIIIFLLERYCKISFRLGVLAPFMDK